MISTTTNQDSDLKTLVYISLLLLHNIVIAFDANPSLEVRGIFLDLSKAFDRVWHDGLPHKLQNNRIEGNLFKHIIAGNVAIWQGSRRKFRGSCFDIWLWIYISNLMTFSTRHPSKKFGQLFFMRHLGCRAFVSYSTLNQLYQIWSYYISL